MIDVGDEVSFGDLLVINIEENLAGRTIDRPADGVGLIGFLQPSATVVGVFVERFEHHDEIFGFEDFRAAAEQVDNIGKLVTLGETWSAIAVPFFGLVVLLIDRPGNDGHPGGVAPSGDGHGLTHLIENHLMGVRIAVGKCRRIKTPISDEHAHLHVEVSKGLPNGLLLIGRTTGHTIIFPGGEALVGGELDLIDHVVPREGLEHSGVGGVAETEFWMPAGMGVGEKSGLAGEQGTASDSRRVKKSATIHGVIKLRGEETRSADNFAALSPSVLCRERSICHHYGDKYGS